MEALKLKGCWERSVAFDWPAMAAPVIPIGLIVPKPLLPEALGPMAPTYTLQMNNANKKNTLTAIA